MGKKISESRRRRKRQLMRRVVSVVGCIIICGSVVFIGKSLFPNQFGAFSESDEEMWIGAPEMDVQLLSVNEYSRPGTPLEKVNGVVIHYVGNPNTSAAANRNYFQGLKDSKETKASSHFIVGLEGEIVQCVPCKEISYASNERNVDTIAIETCHPDETGKFNEKTYQSLVHLTGWLCSRYQLTSEDVIRHYDITGKMCPLYFVEHEDAWQQFKLDVEIKIQEINQWQQEKESET